MRRIMPRIIYLQQHQQVNKIKLNYISCMDKARKHEPKNYKIHAEFVRIVHAIKIQQYGYLTAYREYPSFFGKRLLVRPICALCSACDSV